MLRGTSLAAVALIALAVTVSACGQQHANAGSVAGPGSGHSSPVAGGKSGACKGRTSPSVAHTVSVGPSDNGKIICVKPGTGLMVILRGTPDRKWAPIHASTDALVPKANGRMLVQLGVTAAYFVASHAGTSVITSARPACAKSTRDGHPASPNSSMACDVELAFHATVTVTS